MRTMFMLLCLGALALPSLTAPAHAQNAPLHGPTVSEDVARASPTETARSHHEAPVRDELIVSEESHGSAERAGEQALLLPFAQSPQIFSGQAVVKTIAGYDTALKSFVARSSAEARVLRPLALRVDFDHGPGMGPDNRFGVGARLQLLGQEAHGVDGALSLAYQPNDFRQEGQIVAAALLGRSFGRLRLLGNVLFGGDAEGDDQAGEARVSALYRVLRQLHVGFDSRFRFNVSQDGKRIGTQTTNFELQATPTASFALGPMALLAQSGLSVIQRTGPSGAAQEKTRIDIGLVALAGVGAAF